MEKEFNLSDKIKYYALWDLDILFKEDIKEFLRLLKGLGDYRISKEDIDKLAGDKLNGN